MTNGAVAVLGPIGRNAAAGMTGGVAYFLDEGNNGPINTELVDVVPVQSGSKAAIELKSLIQAHVANTGSARGKAILSEWDSYLPKFVQLVTQGVKMKAAADAVTGQVSAVNSDDKKESDSPRGDRDLVATR
jgi:glutamate synthase (ferredoxin)